MKKILYTILIATTVLIVGCDTLFYDDAVITGRVDGLEDRVTALETICA
ncbi:MAG: hypothetical protein SOZ00_07005 [Tidjanibacter sp.]|nr:hypothetical protein [Tidjanibacter sp.]